MSRYSELHPALVDEMTTRSVLSSLPPPPVPTLTETSSSGTKRGRSLADDEPPAQAKKARYVDKIKLLTEHPCSGHTVTMTLG